MAEIIQDFGTGTKATVKATLAQINVGTTERDYADAKDDGAAVDRTSVKLAKVPNVLDLLTGTTSGEAEVNFGTEDMPSQTLTVRKGEDDEMEYRYLSMNYVLVGGDGTAVGDMVTLDSYSVSFYAGSKIIDTVLVSNVPARRNWRTNIVSNNMLTGDATFNVTIEPGFYGEYYGNNGNFEELIYQ